MDTTLAIGIYIFIWWITLFAVLPFGVRTQQEAGEVVPEITTSNFSALQEALQASDGVADVTGGMLHKVQRSLEMGVRTEIINGMRPGLLKRALLGEQVPGTVVHGG